MSETMAEAKKAHVFFCSLTNFSIVAVCRRMLRFITRLLRVASTYTLSLMDMVAVKLPSTVRITTRDC